MSKPTEKACIKCGLPQPPDCFPLRKVGQPRRNTCKGCRAAEHRARRSHPANVERLREQERVRNTRRRSAICAWERAHPEQMRPGRQRRMARRTARRRADRPPTYRPLLGPFQAVLPPARRGRPPKRGQGV